MKTCFRLTLCLALLGGCRTELLEVADGFCQQNTTDGKPSDPPDMATPAPKCAAAKGLAGDNLLCVDFKDVQNLSSLGGWAFVCLDGSVWSTTSGKLQVNSFSTFMSTCTATPPPLSAMDYQKYSSFTLSVVHRVDLNSLQQKAQIMLGGADEQQRLLDWNTGKQPRQQNIYQIAKTDLPLMAMGNFQPVLLLNSSVAPGGGYVGWQIESIAINGQP